MHVQLVDFPVAMIMWIKLYTKWQIDPMGQVLLLLFCKWTKLQLLCTCHYNKLSIYLSIYNASCLVHVLVLIYRLALNNNWAFHIKIIYSFSSLRTLHTCSHTAHFIDPSSYLILHIIWLPVHDARPPFTFCQLFSMI